MRKMYCISGALPVLLILLLAPIPAACHYAGTVDAPSFLATAQGTWPSIPCEGMAADANGDDTQFIMDSSKNDNELAFVVVVLASSFIITNLLYFFLIKGRWRKRD